MAALALSVLRGIVENDLKLEKVYVYLPQVNCAFSNMFASILRRSPIARQRLSMFVAHPLVKYKREQTKLQTGPNVNDLPVQAG